MTPDDLRSRIASLSPAQQDRLRMLLRDRRPETPPSEGIPRRRSERPPLSHGQRRLWFLAQVAPDSPHYNVPMASRLTGTVDPEILARSVSAVIDRHEGLRTTFAVDDHDEPYQQVHDHMPVPLPVIDLSAAIAAESGDGPPNPMGLVARAEMVRLAQQPFDLQAGPLVRTALLRLAPGEHVLIAIMHHIVVDTWSIGVILQELAQCYDALGNGQSIPFDNPPLQYPDYAEWQRSTLSGEALQSELQYWKDRLGTDLEPLALPFDRPRPPDPRWSGAKYVQFLPAELGPGIDAACARHQVTPFTFFLAALATLLCRFTGETRVRIGSAVANRDRRDLAGMVGYVSNTVAMMTDLAGDPTFAEILDRARDTTLGAQHNQNVPFDLVVDAVAAGRGADTTTPLIQVFLLLERSAQTRPSAGLGAFTEAIPIDNATAKFDLQFGVEPNQGTYRVEVEYSTELFDLETVQRLTDHLGVLLAAVVADPDVPLSRVPLLTAEERATVVGAWNATEADYPDDRCLHELISAQARRTPEATAVVETRDGGSHRLSYRALDEASDRLAARLAALGAGPDVPVAIATVKSGHSVTGLLGILKAGSAFVPVDPDYPAQRIAYLLDDAAAPVLVTTSDLAERFGGYSGSVVLLDEEPTEPAPPFVPPVLTPDHLAYLIYTSGSTGAPKGALLPHRGRVNNFTDFIRRFALGPGDAVLAVSSLSFDMSAFDLLGTLMAGATVVLADTADRDPAQWVDLIRTHDVTVWHSVPALLQMLVTHLESGTDGPLPDTGALPSLRLALLGGDWIPVDLPRRLRALAPQTVVVGLGGATEVSMDSTLYVVEDVAARRLSIPYGRPMANQRCYVLDERHQPVPVGVVGDLYLAGVGVGRGYHRRPDLTAERFVSGLLPEEPGPLYRTGDRCRYLRDGNLQLLGRSDHQVKIRGWRVEPGEVEAALLERPEIAEALVTAWTASTESRHLVGYLVPTPGHSIDEPDLRAALGRQLPGHLVPTYLVVLEALPLTANGKVDHSALPAPEAADAASAEYVPPSTDLQAAMLEIWQTLLPDAATLGVRDSFFARGGDSIMVIQMVTRLRRLGVDLSPAAVFRHQTIEALEPVARQTDDAGPATRWSAPEATRRQLAARVPDLVDVYPATGMQAWMCEQLHRRPVDGLYVIQADYLFAEGGLDPDALERAWRTVIARHPVLRTTFHRSEAAAADEPTRWLQVVSAEVSFAVEYVDLRALDTDAQVAAQAELVDDVRRTGFPLDRGPMVRVHLMRIGDDQYKYLCSNHHIVMDGWSRAIVQQEVFAEYEALLTGQPVPEPAHQSFGAYAAWLSGRDLTAAREFFTAHLEGSEPTPMLRATGRPNPGCGGPFRKHRERFGHDEEVAAFCRKYAPLTVNTLFQAAWYAVMARRTGRTDLVLGVTSSGRAPTFDGVDTVTGVCMNTLPVRTRLQPDQPLVAWLTELQDIQLQVREYEHAPLATITAWAGRPPGEAPFETMMVFENYPWDGSLQRLGDRMDLDHPMAQPDFQWAQFEWPLRVEVAPGAGSLMIMHYYVDAFADDTIAALMGEWRALLLQIVHDPTRPVRELIDP